MGVDDRTAVAAKGIHEEPTGRTPGAGAVRRHATDRALRWRDAKHLLFLSHAGADSVAAVALAESIEASAEARERGLAVWIDKKDLGAGRWKDQLQEALDKSTAFAVYVGAGGVVNWVWDEVSVALDKAHDDASYPLIPIFAGDPADAALPGFVTQYQGVQGAADVTAFARSEQFAKLLRGVLRLDAREKVAVVDEPFRGLRAFDSRSAHLFFGREAETAQLVDKLGTEHLVMVVGDSGSGKSSLVKAGLIPAFRGGAFARPRDDGPDDTLWHVVETRPGADPFVSLADHVADAAERVGIELGKCFAIKERVRGDGPDHRRTRDPHQVRDAVRAAAPPDAKVLLVVDQFEELLTLAAESDRQPYVDALMVLANAKDDAIRVVLTMRRDYYNLCSVFEAFHARLEAKERNARMLLRRIEEDGLRACVTEPLRLGGVQETHREALAEAVLRDVGDQPGDLALLEMALDKTWRTAGGRGDELLTAYTAIGRVEGALADAAERVFTKKLKREEPALAEPLFIRLVRLGDTGGTTRRIAAKAEFSEATWALAQKLATEDYDRLLVVHGDKPGDDQGDRRDDDQRSKQSKTVEIAHEALVTQWSRYQRWLQNHEQDRRADDKRTLDRLTDRVARWHATGEKEEDVAQGTERDDFGKLKSKRPAWLAPAENSFILASDAAYAAEQTRQRVIQERERDFVLRLKRAFTVTGIVALVAIGAGSFAGYQWKQATDAQTEAEQQRAAAEAERQTAEGERDRAEAAQVEAERTARFSVATLNALRETESLRPSEASRLGLQALEFAATRRQRDLAEAIVLRALFAVRFDSLEGHVSSINAAALSKDGDYAVTGSTDGCVIVWELEQGRPSNSLKGHKAAVHAVDFDPLKKRVLSAALDGTAKVWNAVTGEHVSTAQATGEPVVAAFSPDGESYATGSNYGDVELWASGTGERIAAMAGHRERITSLAFSPSGDEIVTASEDGTAKVWQSRTGAIVAVLIPDDDARQRRQALPAISSAEFSPDGELVVTASHDGAVRVWHTEDGELRAMHHKHRGIVDDAEFSPDGRLVVSGGSDRTVVVWALETKEVVSSFTGHQGHVYSVDFSPDGRRVVSASDDGSAKVWDALSGRLEEALSWHLGTVWGAAFTPDGEAVLTWSADGTAALWPRSVISLLGHSRAVYTIALSPEENLLATASADGTVRLWEADDGAFVRSLEDPDARTGRGMYQAAFAPSGYRLITAASDGAIQVWNTGDGRLLEQYQRPDEPATDALYAPNEGPIVGVYEDGLVRWWREGRLAGEARNVGRHDRPVQEIRFSPDGDQFLTSSLDGTAILWDSASGTERHRLQGHEKAITSAAFSPDGQQVATASMDETARVWSTASGDLLEVLDLHSGPLAGVAFSSGGDRIATASWDRTARIWDARTFEPLVRLGGHEGRVHRIAFFDDGRLAATTSWDGSARIWHVATGLEVAALEGHRGIVHSMAIGPKGSWLATASEDATARIWALPYGEGMDVEAAAQDFLANRSAGEPVCPQPR